MTNDPYFIDYPGRIQAIQREMAVDGIDVYLGSRLRTLSWTTDAFFPWRSYIVIPAEGMPTVFTFVIDAARAADDSWLDTDHVLGFAPMGGQDQITAVSDRILSHLKGKKGVIGVEAGMSNYLPEGNLTYYEYKAFEEALAPNKLVNALDIIDRLSMIKDEGTINRFRKAGLMADAGHAAVYNAIKDGGFKNLTETQIAGIAAIGMRDAGSTWEWSFTGGNEIAAGYRSGYMGGACTPPTDKKLMPGEALTVDLHSTYRLCVGDHTHNYLLAPATDRQKWHAQNFVDLVTLVLKTYKAGITPSSLADEMMIFCEERGFAEYMVPGFEHGIGMIGDEWRIGRNDGPFPYWTNPDHVYQPGEMLICALQYACPEEKIGFRYENAILINKDNCEYMSKFPLAVEVIE
jgi:Xaa-Pro aminopeptidase